MLLHLPGSRGTKGHPPPHTHTRTHTHTHAKQLNKPGRKARDTETAMNYCWKLNLPTDLPPAPSDASRAAGAVHPTRKEHMYDTNSKQREPTALRQRKQQQPINKRHDARDSGNLSKQHSTALKLDWTAPQHWQVSPPAASRQCHSRLRCRR
jgi:hypothetical protein